MRLRLVGKDNEPEGRLFLRGVQRDFPSSFPGLTWCPVPLGHSFRAIILARAALEGWIVCSPEPFEPTPCYSGVPGRVPWLTMAEVVLRGAKVGATVGKVEATRMPEHVRPDVAKASTTGSTSDQVVLFEAGEVTATLCHKEPREDCLSWSRASSCLDESTPEHAST